MQSDLIKCHNFCNKYELSSILNAKFSSRFVHKCIVLAARRAAKQSHRNFGVYGKICWATHSTHMPGFVHSFEISLWVYRYTPGCVVLCTASSSTAPKIYRVYSLTAYMLKQNQRIIFTNDFWVVTLCSVLEVSNIDSNFYGNPIFYFLIWVHRHIGQKPTKKNVYKSSKKITK